MRRHPSLRELSVDHHHGLVQAHRVLKAVSGDAESLEAASLEFLEFWSRELIQHFREEEEVLLPIFARYGGDMTAPPVSDMLREHILIRASVMDLKHNLEQAELREDTLRTLGSLLEAHIRLEERVVFPLIEESTPEVGLAEIASLLQPRSRTCNL